MFLFLNPSLILGIRNTRSYLNLHPVMPQSILLLQTPTDYQGKVPRHKSTIWYLVHFHGKKTYVYQALSVKDISVYGFFEDLIQLTLLSKWVRRINQRLPKKHGNYVCSVMLPKCLYPLHCMCILCTIINCFCLSAP